MGELKMRNVIIAGVSAVALTLSGAAFAAGAANGGAMNGQNDTTTSSSHSMKSGTMKSAAGQNGQIMQVQEKLKQEGLYKGKVDGVDGQKTRAALKQYQAKNGLEQTGRVDHKTEQKLGLNTTGSNATGNATEGSGSSTPPASMHHSKSMDTGNQAGGAATTPQTGTMSK